MGMVGVGLGRTSAAFNVDGELWDIPFAYRKQLTL